VVGVQGVGGVGLDDPFGFEGEANTEVLPGRAGIDDCAGPPRFEGQSVDEVTSDLLDVEAIGGA